MMTRATVRRNGEVTGADVRVRDGVLRIEILGYGPLAEAPEEVIEVYLSEIPKPS